MDRANSLPMVSTGSASSCAALSSDQGDERTGMRVEISADHDDRSAATATTAPGID